MPRYAPELECSVEDKASLVALTKSRTAEAHAVERARIILACLEGKEILARELGVSLATVSKWRERFSLWGLRGLRDPSGGLLSQFPLDPTAVRDRPRILFGFPPECCSPSPECASSRGRQTSAPV
jgi:hypothetical protein